MVYGRASKCDTFLNVILKEGEVTMQLASMIADVHHGGADSIIDDV
jgi:hypothetical protein